MTMSESAHESLLLSVAIVVYQSDESLLRRTLGSLARAVEYLRQHEPSAMVRLSLIDNGASQASAASLARLLEHEHPQHFFRAELLSMPRNLGYGVANNCVIERGLGQFHLVLNPDVELNGQSLWLGVDWLRNHQDVVALVPQGFDAQGEPLFLAKRFPEPLLLLARALRLGFLDRALARRLARYEARDICAAGNPAPVLLASGCCMLMRADAFLAIGGFSPRYFLYFEDFDLSLRLARLGRVMYLPSMRVVHHGGHAARKGLRHSWLFMRSMLRFFAIWGWRGGRAPQIPEV